MMIKRAIQTTTACLLFVGSVAPAMAADLPVRFEQSPGTVRMLIEGRPLATYVYQDPKIFRPYIAHLRAPDGVQVTRSHPPVEGTDATDHDTMHPGVWLAFGDISGADFWRNKGRVEHVEFIEEPTSSPDGGRFVVRNRYLSGETQLCEEVCKIAIWARPQASIIVWDSTFTGAHEFYFGDQEEMGLGIRLATPLTVKNGGTITNSDSLQNEKQVWGKAAEWCDYAGTIEGQHVGLLIVPDPLNFRPSWFHARDYGVLVANPFGLKAFTGGNASRVTVPVGRELRLRFAVVAHSGQVDLSKVAGNAVTELNATR